MAKFFINRPIVAIGISIVTVIVGLVSLVQLPTAQFPNIAPPEITIQSTYVGADALTVAQSVATPIEQQMSGVDGMLYMYSINSSTGGIRLNVDFDVKTDPNIDQVLAQMRYTQAEPQLPLEIRNYGVTIRKSASSPLALFALYSPQGSRDALFLANYAYIHLNAPMTRVPGVGQVSIFGAGQYAMRLWVSPDVLAKLGITVSEILDAISQQNTVNPAGQVGAQPVPPGQQFTYTVRAQGRLASPEDFENIIIRANPDGSLVRVKDVARVELGAQTYNIAGRLNGAPAAIIVVYQLPGSNALDTVNRAKALEDQGYFYLNVQLSPAASLQRTSEVCQQIEQILKETPGVQTYNTVVSFSLQSLVNTTYNGFFFVTLQPWRERDRQGLTAEAIMRLLNQQLTQLPDAIAFTFAPPAILGVGTSGGITFVLEDRSGGDVKFLADNTDKFLAAARKRPEFASLRTTLLPGVPQLFADVDRQKALKQQVPLRSVYQTLQAFMGGYFVNYFNEFGRVWQIYVQAEGEYRTEAEQAGQFYVRNTAGQMVPLSTLVTIENTSGPEFIFHYNGYRAAQILGSLAPGYSSGQGMQALEEVFAETMPEEMGYDYMGMSFQEKTAAEGAPASVIFGFSLLMVFLILAAQYESWSLPFSVLLSVPVAVLGAFAALFVRAFVNNVYAQIGLVMLIGLSAKNAILIVEFSKNELERGRSIVDAALAGARLRLRPILMTAFAFIFGVAPLTFATGAGAAARQVLGTTVIGGMTAASLIAIFLIPVSFYVVETFAHRKERRETQRNAQLAPTEDHGLMVREILD